MIDSAAEVVVRATTVTCFHGGFTCPAEVSIDGEGMLDDGDGRGLTYGVAAVGRVRRPSGGDSAPA